MAECKPIGNPCDVNAKLTVDSGTTIVGQVPYQEAVGCLLFVAPGTRPDIAYAVHSMSRFNSCYTAVHWQAVKRIMRYLSGTINYTLTYSRSQKTEVGRNLVGFTDADWASDVDNRQSVTGYVFLMADGAVAWLSIKQPTVALSSTEAEYVALAATVQEAIWLRQLAKELGAGDGILTPINCDNQSAIKLAQCAGFRPRTRHIDIKYHFLREHEERDVEILFVSTNTNLADVLTKAVSGEKLVYCTKGMGLN